MSQQELNFINDFLESLPTHSTRRAYKTDLRAFAHSLAPQQPNNDLTKTYLTFFRLPSDQLRETWWTYRNELHQQGRAPTTINRRLAAIKSLVRFARSRGLTSTDEATLNLEEGVEPYPDTQGIGEEELQRLFRAPGTETLRECRDTAILRLLGESGLRRGELCALKVADFDPEKRTLLVPARSRKQASEKERTSLSPECADAIIAYLIKAGHAGEPETPLFRNLDRNPDKTGEQLTIDGIYFLVRHYGEEIGLPTLSPNRLRHSAINRKLEETGGDKRAARALSRHQDDYALTRYEQNRKRRTGR